jgi:hypothetical protein
VLVIFFFLDTEAGDRGQFRCPCGMDVPIVKTQQSLSIVSLPWPGAVGTSRLDSSVAGCGGDCWLLTLACRYWCVTVDRWVV